MLYKVTVTAPSSPWLLGEYVVEAADSFLAEAAGTTLATDDYGQKEYLARAEATTQPEDSLSLDAASH